MTEEKRRFKTTIAGRPYTIVGSKSPDHLQAVADLVEEQISQIQRAMPVLDVEQRSILVAVNAVSQSLEKQHEMEALKEQIAELQQDRDALLVQLDQADAELSRYSHPGETERVEEEVQMAPIDQSDQHREQQPPQRSKPAGKKAGLRFVRPTTASQAFLQRAEMLDNKEQDSSRKERSVQNRRQWNNTPNREQ